MAISTIGQNGLAVPLVTSADASISGLTVGKGTGGNANNTVVGYQAGYSGSGYLTAIGYQAGYSSTVVGANVFAGYQTGYSNTSGSENNAIGYHALYYNSSGSYNVAIGDQALNFSTAGSYNVAIGHQAGYNLNVSGGNFNSLLGYQAGYGLTSGVSNTFIGASSDYPGFGSGNAVTTGSYNTILGPYSGNQGGLDIRTSSSNLVLSDGHGNPRIYDNATTTFVASSVSTTQGTNTRLVFPYGVFGGGVVSGTSAYNTNIPINQGGGGGNALLMISSNGGAGVTTRNAVYSIQFYYDGSNTPTLRFISGSHDYISAGQSGGTLTLTSGYSGNHYYSWWINKT